MYPELLLSLASLVKFATSSSGLEYYQFNVLNSKLPPVESNPLSSSSVSSVVFCIASCAKDRHCMSIHASEDPWTGQLTCHRYSTRFSSDQLWNGVGAYAYIDTITTNDQPPTFYMGNYQYTTRYRQGLVAVYSFTSYSYPLKTVGVMYDSLKRQWPAISTACADRLYGVRGLTATVFSIEEEQPGYSYRVRAHCQDDEINWGDATCTGSSWVISGDANMACVSNSCYRVDASRRAQYSGTNHRTRYGTGCTYWNGYVSSVYFPLDGHDATAANRYCRDPYNYGRPWCYILPYYDYCSVPECDWSPFP